MGKAKLTAEQVRMIAKLYKPGTSKGPTGLQEGSMSWLARTFGVSTAVIYKIVHRQRLPNPTTKDRFMKFVRLTESGCWEWLGALDKDGYGYFTWPEARIKRPRPASLLLFKNEKTPKGRTLGVSCKNQLCVHPEHIIARRRYEGNEASFHRRYLSYKSRAARISVSFLFSETEFRQLTSAACFYCGTLPKARAEATKGTKMSYFYNGLDRKQPKQGYTSENCVPCCWTCNKMKTDMSAGEFLAHIQAVSQNKPSQ